MLRGAMTAPDYSSADVPVRDDLTAAHRRIWESCARRGRIGRASSGSQLRRPRAVPTPAASVARARTRCHRTRSAASTTAPVISRRAWSTSSIASAPIPAACRVPGMIRCLPAGSGPHYVDLVAVVTFLTGADFFSLVRPRTVSAAEPKPGAPTRYLPAAARPGIAWVALVAPEDASGPEADMYPPSPFIPNIVRALSLVPDAVRTLVDLRTRTICRWRRSATRWRAGAASTACRRSWWRRGSRRSTSAFTERRPTRRCSVRAAR